MKITSKELAVKKEANKTPKTSSHKTMSRSLTKVKPTSSNIFNQSPNIKPKPLAVIKQKNQTPKKKKQKEQKPNNKKKKTNYCINLKQLKPVNLEKQKELFFKQAGSYDPFFIYPNISDLNDQEYKDMRKFETADERYLKLAINILEMSKEIGIHKLLSKSDQLNQAQTGLAFDQYIAKHDISNLITYQFVENTIAPTSVVHNNQDCMSRVLIGLPINYRKWTIEGVMNHEIGTHFIRKLNDRSQKWYKDRKKYNLGQYLQTEEGLAALNQLMSYVMQDTIPPLLFRPALLYYASYLASKMSFSKMYETLSKYQPDPQYRWKQCVRVKRGIADTSKPAGMYKDQIYFMGAIEILQNRKKLNFMHLHGGKISVQDCLKLSEKGVINEDKLKIPHFLKNLKMYHGCLDIIAESNQVIAK